MTLTELDTVPALVVIDLQQGIARGVPDRVAGNAAALATAFRERDLPVVWVTVVAAAPGRTDAPSRLDVRALPPDWAELLDELRAEQSDHRIVKRRRSAFHGTGLDILLRDLGATQVVLAGVSTSAGVESTARSAFDHGYHVVLVADAMSDGDPQMHAHSVEHVFPRLGQVTTTAELLEHLTTPPTH